MTVINDCLKTKELNMTPRILHVAPTNCVKLMSSYSLPHALQSISTNQSLSPHIRVLSLGLVRLRFLKHTLSTLYLPA